MLNFNIGKQIDIDGTIDDFANMISVTEKLFKQNEGKRAPYEFAVGIGLDRGGIYLIPWDTHRELAKAFMPRSVGVVNSAEGRVFLMTYTVYSHFKSGYDACFKGKPFNGSLNAGVSIINDGMRIIWKGAVSVVS